MTPRPKGGRPSERSTLQVPDHRTEPMGLRRHRPQDTDHHRAARLGESQATVVKDRRCCLEEWRKAHQIDAEGNAVHQCDGHPGYRRAEGWMGWEHRQEAKGDSISEGTTVKHVDPPSVLARTTSSTAGVAAPRAGGWRADGQAIPLPYLTADPSILSRGVLVPVFLDVSVTLSV